MLARLRQWRSCRLRGSLDLEGITLWRFGIFRLKCDEKRKYSRLHGSFYRVCYSGGQQMS